MLGIFLAHHLNDRSFISTIGILGLIEDCEHLKVFLMSDGIILMCVTLGAGRCRSHPGRHRGIDTVHNRRVAEFLVARPTLVIGLGIPMEGRCNQLIFGRGLKKVPGNLLNRELIKRHIGIKRTDDPVAVSPDRPSGIVGIAR